MTKRILLDTDPGIDDALALNADGTVAAWGKNWDGQANVPPAATNVVGVYLEQVARETLPWVPMMADPIARTSGSSVFSDSCHSRWSVNEEVVDSVFSIGGSSGTSSERARRGSLSSM